MIVKARLETIAFELDRERKVKTAINFDGFGDTFRIQFGEECTVTLGVYDNGKLHAIIRRRVGAPQVIELHDYSKLPAEQEPQADE